MLDSKFILDYWMKRSRMRWTKWLWEQRDPPGQNLKFSLTRMTGIHIQPVNFPGIKVWSLDRLIYYYITNKGTRESEYFQKCILLALKGKIKLKIKIFSRKVFDLYFKHVVLIDFITRMATLLLELFVCSSIS